MIEWQWSSTTYLLWEMGRDRLSNINWNEKYLSQAGFEPASPGFPAQCSTNWAICERRFLAPTYDWYLSFQSILLFQYSIHAFVFIVFISEIRVHCLYSWFCVDIDTGNISQAARFVENPYSIHTELNCYTVLLHVSCHYIVFQPTWTLEIITN